MSGEFRVPQVNRNKTAIWRHTCSRPIGQALADGIVRAGTTFFDYGCGHETDVRFLRARRVKASGWDPYYKPGESIEPAEVVNLGYVLNVIENPHEREETLRRAFDLAGVVLIVAVRIDSGLDQGTEFGDGILTKRRTFQKLYSQSEFKAYLESTLGRQPYMASLGIAYVFKDYEAESRYLATRVFTRRLEYRIDLVQEFGKNRTAKKYVEVAAKLGRLPLPEEFQDYGKLLEGFGSQQCISRLALQCVDKAAFSGSQAQRREDILTYIATLRLQGVKPPPISKLPASIINDIKALWKSYGAALSDGERYLFSLGNPMIVQKACETAPVGKLLPSHLYVHRSAEDELPAILRLVIFAAKQVVGDVPYNLVKLATDARTVSFLDYPDFDEDPHPALLHSVRVYLPKASYSIRSYRDSTNQPILHRKETFIASSYPYYEKFRALTEQEEAAGLLSAPGIGFREQWETLLRDKGLTIHNHRLISVAEHEFAHADN